MFCFSKVTSTSHTIIQARSQESCLTVISLNFQKQKCTVGSTQPLTVPLSFHWISLIYYASHRPPVPSLPALSFSKYFPHIKGNTLQMLTSNHVSNSVLKTLPRHNESGPRDPHLEIWPCILLKPYLLPSPSCTACSSSNLCHLWIFSHSLSSAWNSLPLHQPPPSGSMMFNTLVIHALKNLVVPQLYSLSYFVQILKVSIK